MKKVVLNTCASLFFNKVAGLLLDDCSAATKMNSDLCEINVWSNQWKMTFNPDPNKQPQEVIFSRKMKKTLHPPLNFNDNSVKQVQF